MPTALLQRLAGQPLCLASHNEGKLAEIRDLLSAHLPDIRGAADLAVPEPRETGASFTENAVLKARHAAELTGFAALGDDSGLCVEALGGDPGIYSARWAVTADGARDFGAAMAELQRRLEAIDPTADRAAHFVCVLALAWPGGEVETFKGRVDGTLIWPPRGTRGFGYDPMFVPAGHEVTFGQMDPAAKHRISHRADAFAKFRTRLA